MERSDCSVPARPAQFSVIDLGHDAILVRR